MRVTSTGQWLEWQDWAHPVFAEPFEVHDGHRHLPDVAGNGLAWDEAAVTRTRERAAWIEVKCRCGSWWASATIPAERPTAAECGPGPGRGGA